MRRSLMRKPEIIFCGGDNPLDFKNLKFTRSTAESQALNMDRNPKVIISASGMCEAGRIRHHLKHNLWDPKSSVIFVGYQAEGTLGKLLVEGAKDIVLFGEEIHVNAEIYNLEGFSGHADQSGLFAWAAGFQKKPKQVFLVHGEEDSKKISQNCFTTNWVMILWWFSEIRIRAGYEHCAQLLNYEEAEAAGRGRRGNSVRKKTDIRNSQRYRENPLQYGSDYGQ